MQSNFHTFITLSLFNVLAALVSHSSLLLQSCTATDNILSKNHWSHLSYASPCLWDQLPLSLRQLYSGTSSSISDSPIPSTITSSFDSQLCSSIPPSLFHPGLKPTYFTIPTPRSFTSSSGLPSRTIARTASELYSVFVFSFSLIFSFMSRALD